MANLGLQNLNPGNLTVNYPGQMLYAGQTSTYSSPNGFVYAVFGTAQAGWDALVTYINNHAAGQTVGQILQRFGAPAQANSANPNPGAYVSNFESGSGGLSTSAPATGNATTIAAGIATAEGAGSLIPLAVRLRVRRLVGASPASPQSTPSLTGSSASATALARASLPPIPPTLSSRAGSEPASARQGRLSLLARLLRLQLRPTQTPSELEPPSKASKRGLPPKGPELKLSVSTLRSVQSGLSSSPLASQPSPSPTVAAAEVPPLPRGVNFQQEASTAMSELSVYIKSHTAFFNSFIPALKGIVDSLPLPPEVTSAFNAAYSLAPVVVETGAAAVSALEGGAPQPAAQDIVAAFAGVPAATPAPAPAPVAPVVALTPPPAPSPTPGLLLVPQPTTPSTVAATAPATFPAVAPLTPAEEAASAVNPSELAALAAAMGMTLLDATGNKVPAI